jgi:protein-disulfide isomerase
MGGAPTNQVAQLPNLPSPSADPGAPQPTVPSKPVKEVGPEDHIRGNKNAKVTLIEYSDYECPFCKRHEPSMAQALKDFPNDVRVVYRHYPLTSIHPNAQKAAEAAECANKLGGNDAFWKMHDKMFEISPALSPDALVAAAKGLGLNEANFKKCLDSGEMAARVDADVASGNDSGVEGTPATFINGQLVSGAVPYASMKAQIQAAGAAN